MRISDWSSDVCSSDLSATKRRVRGRTAMTNAVSSVAEQAAPGMPVYCVLSALLSYPDSELLAALPELQAVLDVRQRAQLAPVFALLGSDDLISLQEQYVATFDRRPVHSLHLFEHIHGES